jgi:hypothetical protein
MTSHLNFAAEPFGRFSSLRGDRPEQQVSIRLSNPGHGPIVHGGRWGYGYWGGGRNRFGRWGRWRRWPWMGSGFGFGFDPSAQDPQTIAWAQGCLAQIVGSWVPQDGMLSPVTRNAIRTFQSQMQLPPTGALDDNTIAALQQACQQGQQGAPANVNVSPAAPPGGQTEIPDFPHEFEGEESYETQSDPSNLLAFKIPEAPFSDTAFKWIHRSIDVFEQVHLALEIFGVEAAGMLGLAFTALAPIIIWIGGFFALGSATAEARADIARKRVRSGFAIGVVTGADRRPWPYVKQMFWEYSPETNNFDPDAGAIAQKSFNTGLVAGFLQGREVAKNQKKMKFFWDSIATTLSPGDRMQFAGDSKLWPERLWTDWYIRAEASFTTLYLKE